MSDNKTNDAAMPSAEIERRVGRNLLLYQRIENGLKELLLRSSAEGATQADVEKHLAARAAKVMRQNMGEAARDVFETVLTDNPTPLPELSNGSDASIRTRFTIGSHPDNPDYIVKLRERCKAVIDARNDLVHHFLRQTPCESADRLHDALAELDGRHEAALALHNELLGLLGSLVEQQREAATYLAGPDGLRLLELAMAEGRIVDVRAATAQSDARADGWTLLTTALHRAKDAVPADVERVRKAYGKGWGGQLLERCKELFELDDEPTPNGAAGSTRAIYRQRPEGVPEGVRDVSVHSH